MKFLKDGIFSFYRARLIVSAWFQSLSYAQLDATEMRLEKSSSHLMVDKTLNKHIPQNVIVPLNVVFPPPISSVMYQWEIRYITDWYYTVGLTDKNPSGASQETQWLQDWPTLGCSFDVTISLFRLCLGLCPHSPASNHSATLRSGVALWIQTVLRALVVLSQDTCRIKMTGVTTARD